MRSYALPLFIEELKNLIDFFSAECFFLSMTTFRELEFHFIPLKLPAEHNACWNDSTPKERVGIM